jgi:hypothetical protein
MSTAALGVTNHIDATATVLSASGALTTAPVTNLINPHVGKKWRHNTTTTFVLADLGSLKSIDTVMLAGLSGTNPTLRVRLSTVDPTGVAGNAHDSGSISGIPYYDPSYQLFVYLMSTPASARYVRVDITEAAVSFIEAGRWFTGARNVFDVNYMPGWSRSIVRGSQDVIGVGGQTFVDLRAGYCRQDATFDFLLETERTTFIDTIFIAIKNVGHMDMLWIMDPASTNLSRDSIWGYLDGELRTTHTLVGVDPIVYSVALSIRQRL